MGSEPDQSEIAFGRWRLRPRQHQLLCDGVPIPLGSRAFDLLLTLVEARGDLVTKDELLRRVWPGTVVEENNLQVQASALRKALGEDAPRLIATIPGRGYRFTGLAGTATGPSGSDPAVASATAIAQPAGPREPVPAPPTGRPMVVVLPFETIGADPEQAYFADGLTADLVTDLARFQALHVVSPRRAGLRQEHGPPGSPWPNIALPSAAGYVVTGSQRRSGGRIRVTAQLEDAQSGVQLWAERFDRPLDDLFAVQAELAERIAVQLISHVVQEVLRRVRRRPPASLDAYDLVLQGREAHRRGTEADTLAAREIFDRAIAADPDHAPAYAWQAYTVQRAVTHGWGEPRGRAALDLALSLAERAVQIEPDSCLCLGRLAYILHLQGRFDEALETGRAAVQVNPSDFESRYTYGYVLTHAGHPAEAVRELRLAIALDPFCPPSFRAALGRALLLDGQPEAALTELRWCAARMPDYGLCHHTIVVAAVETGRMEEARAALREALRLRRDLPQRIGEGPWAFRFEADLERFRAAFRAAGLPE